MDTPSPHRYGRTHQIAGVRVHVLDTNQVVSAVGGMLSDGGSHQVVTVNAEFIVRARCEPEFRRVLNGSDLSIVDGSGVAFALRWLHGLRAIRVGGADIIPDLAQLAAERGLPVFLLGAMPGVAEMAARRLMELAPGLRIVGTHSGSPDPAEEAAIADMVRSRGARLLLVAFGAPAQEYWIARNLERLGPCVAMGVGGAFDYLAGVMPRAPLWVRRAGFEWLYRLIRQPWRWRRQLALPIFVYLALRELPRSRSML